MSGGCRESHNSRKSLLSSDQLGAKSYAHTCTGGREGEKTTFFLAEAGTSCPKLMVQEEAACSGAAGSLLLLPSVPALSLGLLSAVCL